MDGGSSIPGKSIAGSIPDKDIAPLIEFLTMAREQGIIRLSTDELLGCLLAAALEQPHGV